MSEMSEADGATFNKIRYQGVSQYLCKNIVKILCFKKFIFKMQAWMGDISGQTVI